MKPSSPAVARCIAIYKRCHPASTTRPRNVGWRMQILGCRIAQLSAKEADDYYRGIADFQTALNRAAEIIEWPN